MKSAIVGAAFLVAGIVAVAAGMLPMGVALSLWGRVWPVLLFVVAITIVTELAADAGVFLLVAERGVARWGRGRTAVLWLLVVALATVSTAFLSLDTTAVLLTPVVVAVSRHAKLDPLPFALTTLWLANTASLFLPVSNLTNLLAQNRLGDPDPATFLALMWPAAVAGVVVPAVIVFASHRRALTGSYERSAPTPIGDRPLAVFSGGVVAALMLALVSGVPVWVPAVAAAALLSVAHRVRTGRMPPARVVPWQIVVFAGGLFLFVCALQQIGLTEVLRVAAGTGHGLAGTLRLSAVGGVAANASNNLPAYLALEPVAHSPLRLAALLVGVNAGPLITPWASLATLLWRRQLAAAEVSISAGRLVTLGAVTAPITVAAGTLALWLVHG